MNEAALLRLRAVENEYLSCRAALTYAIREWASITSAPEWQGRIQTQAREALDRLESTYVIRLFSEFEAILRDHWTATESADCPDRVEDLINRLGAVTECPQQSASNPTTCNTTEMPCCIGPLAVSERCPSAMPDAP
jgi:hypothetical protein